MTAIFSALLFVIFIAALVWVFLTVPAAQLASLLSKAVPAMLTLTGAVLTLVGRGAIGIPLIAFGIAWWRRSRAASYIPGGNGGGRQSTVSSSALEMTLDHDSCNMDGRILSGHYKGKLLSQMGLENILDLYSAMSSDPKSAALLEAYLDRAFNDWRDHADPHSPGDQSQHSGSDNMTRLEAYQVLGLEPGASEKEIKQAWRKLMKGMHPDHGGSAFLASKINAAKDILLD